MLFTNIIIKKTGFPFMAFFCSFLFISIGNWLFISNAIASQEKMIYYIVDMQIYNELSEEITQFIIDVSQDTDSKNTLILSEPNQTSEDMREMLSHAFYNDNLWGAFLIGRITPAYKKNPGNDELLSDHPYRAFDCPYMDENNDGIFESASNFGLIPACMPNIWLSRIYPSREGEEGLDQIRSYFNKNHLLRNDNSYFEKKMFYHSSIEIAEEGKTHDDFIDAFTDILTDHPLFTLDDLTISSDTGVDEQIDSFLNAFESNYEIMKINNHGAPTILEFKECEIISTIWKECIAVDVTGTELSEKSSNVKLIDLDSCSNGHFMEPHYFAGEALFSGDTLLVIANPEVTAYFPGHLERDMKTSYYGLGLGFSFADLYTYIDPGHPRHFFGDPTIIFRQKEVNNVPKLAINGTAITEPVRYELDFGYVSDEDKKTVTLSLSNQGESALKIFGRWIGHNISYNDISSPSSTNGFIFSITEPTYLDFDFEEIIEAGNSKNISFQFDPNANNDRPGSANYKGVFKLMTNDPDVGSFQIVTVGNHIVDTPIDGPDVNPMTSADILSITGTGMTSIVLSANQGVYLEDIEAISDSDARINQANKPSDYEFLDGLFSYKIMGLENGATVQITLTFPSDYSDDCKYFKITDNGFEEYTSVEINGSVVTLTLTDGGQGDADGEENGVIVDLGGLADAKIIDTSSPPDTDAGGESTNTGGGGGGGGSGIFGNISIDDLTGYHLDWTTKDGMSVYMPVTNWIKALKGAQTHVESFSPGLANFIREGFDALERRAKRNHDGFLTTFGTYIFPLLGKGAEFYLDVFNSRELMNNAYLNTTISAKEFIELNKQGSAVSSHNVNEAMK